MAYRRLVGNAFATLSGRIASVLLALLLSTLLFRWLGAASYGVWSFFFVLVSYSSIADLGLSTTIERFVARAQFSNDAAAAEATVNQALTFVVGFSLLLQAVVALLPASVWTTLSAGQEIRRVAFVLPLCLLFTNVSTVLGAALAGFQRMGRLNVIRSGTNVLRSCGVLGAALAGVRRVDMLLLLYSALGLLAGLLFWRDLVRDLGRFRLRLFFFRRALAGEFFRFASAVQIASLSYQAGDQVLRVLLGSRFGLPSMAYYDLATRAAYVIRSFASVLLTAMVPFGTEKHLGEGAEGLSRLNRFSVKYLALFVVPATGLAFYYAPELIDIWLSGAAGSAVVLSIFRIFLIGNAVAVLGGPAAMIGRSTGRPATETVLTAGAIVIGLVAALLVPGLVPAVAAYAVFSFGVALVIWWKLARVLGLRTGSGPDIPRIAGCTLVGIAISIPLDRFLATVFPGGKTFAILRLLTVSTFLMAALGAAIWKIGVLDQQERSFWIQRIRDIRRPRARAG